MTIKRKKFRATVSKKQNKIDDIDSIKASINSLRKSVLKKKSRYTENKEVIIEDYSNEYTRSLDSRKNSDNVINIITSVNKDKTKNGKIEDEYDNLKGDNENVSDNGNGNDNSKKSEDESNDSYVLSIASFDENEKNMNININQNIINLNINVNLNSDQINVYQCPENINIDYNTDRNRKDSSDFYKNITQNNGISDPISPIVSEHEDENKPQSARKKSNENN